MGFLLNNGFDFQLPLTHGIPYLSKQEEDDVRSKWIRDEADRSGWADMEIKQDDLPLLDHLRNSVSHWQELQVDEKPAYLNIPSERPPKAVPKTLNRYQIRLVHQVVHKEYPHLKTVGMKNFVQITHPTEEQRANEKAMLNRNREHEISKAVGFRWLVDALTGKPLTALPDRYVINAATGDAQKLEDETPIGAYLRVLQERLSKRRKILVGHNCLTDLVNFYACFVGEPPADVDEFKHQIHELFPAIVDTKLLASSWKRWGYTALGEVELDLRSQSLPQIEMPPDFARYEINEMYHEAGYDSLLTARLMIKLAVRLYLEADFRPGRKDGFIGTDIGKKDSDGYVTAAESITNSETASTTALGTITEALSTPVRALKTLFGLGSSEAPETVAYPLAHDQTQDTVKLSSPSKKVVAIRQKPVDWSPPQEVKAIKSAFASANIFEALHDGASSSSARYDEGTQDLLSFSSDEEGSLQDDSLSAAAEERSASRKTVTDMVRAGELMPRWDDMHGFWGAFGNRLQVNSSQERVMRLD